MDKGDKLLKMFKAVHGDLGCNIKLEVVGQSFSEGMINVTKDGDLCWSVSQSELLFDYLTLDW